MVCDYLKICVELELEVDHSIRCKPLTVMKWLCEYDYRVMLLCDKHATKFSFHCPYHSHVELKWAMLDGPIPTQ